MLATARWPCLLQDVLNRRLLFKTNRRQCFQKPSPIISSFLELGRETVDAAKICGGAENVVKTETQQTFVNGLLGFITLGIYTPLEAHALLLPIIAWVAHRYRQLYLHCSLIYFWVPLPVVLHSDQPLSEGEIIPFMVSASRGGGCIIHAGAWWLHALTDRLLWCATDDDQRQHHHAEHHFQL